MNEDLKDGSQGVGNQARDARDVASKILSRAHQSGWSDFDPYDGLSGFAGWLLPDRALLLRRVATQLIMRTPPKSRWLVGVIPRREAYTAGVLLSTVSVLGGAAVQSFAEELVAVLEETRLLNGAWGYGFPVVTRAACYGPKTGNVIATSFACMGIADLLESGERCERDRLNVMLSDALRWMNLQLWDPEVAVYRYHRGNQEVIYNASILAALVAARAYDRVGEGDTSIVLHAVIRVIEAQRPDGSWPYGVGSHLDWIDNHHTGFTLKALLQLPPWARPSEWEEAVKRGLSFLVERLVTSGGVPKASPDRCFPIDSLAAGQAIETLVLAAAVLGDSQYLTRSQAVFTRTEANLRRRDGRYAFRKGRLFYWPGAYLRWGEAHIALGAARLGTVGR